MVNKLMLTDGDSVLEPCAGDGVFIEKILNSQKENFTIDAVDLNPKAVLGLKEKFNNKNVRVWQADTLLDFKTNLFDQDNYLYSKIIGNPPYGAWQNQEKKELLKQIYGGYVKETYTLFLRKCVDLLETNGRLVFIIPDTFLALHMHKDSREKILKDTKIEEILLIPSNFFPGVNFGYSNLCIISLIKSSENKENKIKIVNIKETIDSLYSLAGGDYSVADYLQIVSQDEILESEDLSFLIGGDTKIRELIRKTSLKLGDTADCVTGFYSGDNKKYIVARDLYVKGSKNYALVTLNDTEFNFLEEQNLLDGLQKGKKYVPFLKSANSAFTKETEWFLRWDKKTVEYYKKSKTSRFQNSKFYFRDGIGVPMIKSAHVHAVRLENRLFDQSVVGIFPREKKYLNYLLAFLNSDVCGQLIKVINHTANNSANYLKKLPIIIDDKFLPEIDEIVRQILIKDSDGINLDRINKIFNRIYGI